MRRVFFFFFFSFFPNEQRAGGGGGAARLFFFFFPCSADHEWDWPPCKVVCRVGNQCAECEKQQQQTTIYEHRQKSQQAAINTMKIIANPLLPFPTRGWLPLSPFTFSRLLSRRENCGSRVLVLYLYYITNCYLRHKLHCIIDYITSLPEHL